MYKNKQVILATKHQKEDSIRPPFESELGCRIDVPFQYDTDQFGTFTGEIPRKLSAYETLVQKAKIAAQQFGYEYAIANEGSFGPHPQLYFAPGDTELMAFIDLKNDLIISEFEISTATNYGHLDITLQDNYEDFLVGAKFPSHALIVRSLDHKNSFLEKGIRELEQLKYAIQNAFKYNHTVRLETDMRAMMNPLRMKVIKVLATKLVRRIQQKCLRCNTPGFGAVSTEGHLACEVCGTETELYAQKVISCLKCDYKIYQRREDGRLNAEQQYCSYCNP